MYAQGRSSLFVRAKNLLLGDARSFNDPSVFHKLSLVAFFAWVGLGGDGLSSSCYGPEEAFLALGRHYHLGIFIALGSVLTIFLISASYHQIIKLFPTGGGGYLVASKLLSPSVGMVSGSALLIDYLLTITLSVASGADALFSFLPASWLPYKLTAAVAGVMLLIWLNLRGVKESVVPLVPIFLIFLITHAFAILYAVGTHAGNIPEIMSTTAGDMRTTHAELGTLGMIFLMLKAYSMGAGTFTGIEAVSNGIPILREPKVKTAAHTMNYMAVSLSVTVLGLMVAYLLFHVSHTPGKTLNAVLFARMTAGWPSSLGYAFVLITLISEAALLFVAAQTGFLDGPRVLANMALDRWAPARFSSLNDRLVTQNGILIMGAGAIALMLYSAGSVKLLVIFYSINVFITFTLSQLGMVRHWWKERSRESRWGSKLLINGVGLILTTFILVSVIVLKFDEGGWMTLFITGSLIILSLFIKRHYNRTGKLLRRLDGLMEVAESDRPTDSKKGGAESRRSGGEINLKDKTAVLFVNGFSGTGLHTLFTILRLFPGIYKNFVFVQIGLIDSGVFKGAEEISELKEHISKGSTRYVEYMRRHGYFAESLTSIAVDVVDESLKLATEILARYPQAVFFAGQLVFPEDTFFTRWLHNFSAFAIQRSFYHQGIPIVILPIRL